MNVSLQSISAMARSLVTILPTLPRVTVTSVTAQPPQVVNAFNSLNGVVNDPALMPSLNITLQLQRQAHANLNTRLNEMRVFFNTMK